MAPPAINICTQITTLLRADSAFSGINGYVIGEPFPRPATQNYPLCEVVITDEGPDPQDTSNYYRRFNGFIRFSALSQDRIAFDVNSVYTVTSYSTVYTYAQDAIELLGHKWTNETSLGGLTLDTGGVVQSFDVDNGVQYGVGERENSYEMSAEIPFTCLTRETRDFS